MCTAFFFQYWTCFLPHQENVFDVNDNCWLIDWYCVMFAGSWFADVVLFDVYWCVASLCNVLSIYVLWFTRCCLLATLAHSLQQRRTRIQVSILKSQRASVVFKSSIVTTSWRCYRASGRHGFQRINGWGCLLPWFPIHSGNTPWIHLSQCEICVIPSHCKPCKPCKPEDLSLEKQKPRENCNLPFFSTNGPPWGAYTADHQCQCCTCRREHFDHGGGCRCPWATEAGPKLAIPMDEDITPRWRGSNPRWSKTCRAKRRPTNWRSKYGLLAFSCK